MNQNSPKPGVRGGIPWWIWVSAVVATVAVVIGIVTSSIPDDPEELYQGAITSIEASEMDDLEKVLTKLRKFPDYESHVILLQGMQAAAMNRDPRAIELFEEAQKNESLKPLALQKAGLSHVRIGNFDDAIKCYDESVRLSPEDTETSQLMSARLYANVGALRHAENILTQVLDANPESRSAWESRGQIRSELFDFAGAAEDLGKILETPGDRAAASPETISRYVRCIVAMNDDERMKKANEELKAELPDTDGVLKGLLEFAAGDVEAVQQRINHHVADPSMPTPMYTLEAIVALHEGDASLASEKILQAIQLKPRDVGIFELALKIFQQAGDEQKTLAAQQNLDQLASFKASFLDVVDAIDSDVHDADKRLEAADLLLEMGNYPEAIRWWTIAGMVDPTRREESQKKMLEAGQIVPKPLVPLVPEEDAPQTQSEPPEASSESSDADSTEADPQTETNSATTSEKESNDASSADDQQKTDEPPGEDDSTSEDSKESSDA